MISKATFSGGRNIAMKVPPHQFEATVRFYRDVLGFTEKSREDASVCFTFGANRLWIDRTPSASQAEIWLEVVTDDVQAASTHLKSAGIVRCDEIEPLPEGMKAFWVSNPASIVHLFSQGSEP
jgi:catechol 2,3-dioxygenase-like lactoylglutathione lyase family enzyme